MDTAMKQMISYKMISNKYKTNPNDRIRVAIYARVSTEHEQQVSALENQIQWYNSLFRDHSNWEKVAEYIDKGVTGTQANKRHGFMKMIEDARQGVFSLIVTREVSRFARNTLDSLGYTRLLKSIGVEVFFYNDNIWSCEEDGELRLTIMSAMSQEESRHISDRVLAGQATSREKSVLYGNGNLLGYRLVKGAKSCDNTYEIVEEEAETVRLIYSLYLQNLGAKKIANKMVELHRPKAKGGYRWCTTDILRIINNKTYCGYIGYNKSYTTDFLNHTRKMNRIMSSYEYVEGNFPPIISEEAWNKAQKLKEQKQTMLSTGAKGKRISKDHWIRKLHCECGSTYKKFKWRTNQDGEVSYGYRCYNQINNRKKDYYLNNGLDGTGYCNIHSICQWKLDFMFKGITERLWKNPNKTMTFLIENIQDNMVISPVAENDAQRLEREQKRLEKRMSGLIDMRLDGQIDNETYNEKYNALQERIESIQAQLSQDNTNDTTDIDTDEITNALSQVREYLGNCCGWEQKSVSEELVDAIVSRIVPTEAGIYKWYIDVSDSDDKFQEEHYALCDKFTLDFESAKTYRKKFGNFIRARQWKDLQVEVYIKL